jgi:hypothetical protein
LISVAPEGYLKRISWLIHVYAREFFFDNYPN